jgi:DNA-binding MarR family transcriptional regulator
MQRRLGVTAKQRLIVRCLGKYPGLTAGQLAAILHVDPGTLSAALRRLEQKDLVQRRKDPRDKRRVSLGLTKRGHALDVSTEGTVEHAVERLLQSASQDDLGATARVLTHLTAHLGAEL